MRAGSMLLVSCALLVFGAPIANGQPAPTASASGDDVELPPPTAAPTPELDVPTATPALPATPSAAPVTAAPPLVPVVVAGPADCAQAPACQSHGMCAARAGRCVAADDAMCRRSAVCLRAGACRAIGGTCVASLPPPTAYGFKPRSEGAMWGGVILSLSGVGLGLLSIPLWLDSDMVLGAVVLTPTASALIITGVPMWALGASDIPSYAEPRDTPLMVGGLVLAGLGTVGLTASTVVVATIGDPGLWLVPLVLSGGGMIGGGAMAAVGAESTTPWDAAWAPAVRIGVGAVDMRWTF